MRRRTWIVALGLTLVLARVGWHFGHEIMGVVRTLTCRTSKPPAGTVRFAIIGDYASGRSQERTLLRSRLGPGTPLYARYRRARAGRGRRDFDPRVLAKTAACKVRRLLESRLRPSRALYLAQARRYRAHALAVKAWGADAVLSGFYHVYERLSVDELPYFVNGAGRS
ncbi:MAG: hypothetical protein ACHBNF_08900 [Chromatiales bacterium]